MNDSRSKVAGRIRQYRKNRGLTLHELSEMTGIAASNLSAIELNKSSPTLNTLIRIAEAFDVRAGEFLDALAYPPARLIPLEECRGIDPSDQAPVYPGSKIQVRLEIIPGGQEDYPPPIMGHEMIVSMVTGSAEILVDDEVFSLDRDACLHIMKGSDVRISNTSGSDAKLILISLKE
jgi:transcriptional regulator with XRE-family HTH domain